jgi:hypothetical protein
MKWINKRFQNTERHGTAILWPLRNPDPEAKDRSGDRVELKERAPIYTLCSVADAIDERDCNNAKRLTCCPLATVYLHGSHIAVAQVDIAGKIK